MKAKRRVQGEGALRRATLQCGEVLRRTGLLAAGSSALGTPTWVSVDSHNISKRH